MTFASPNFFKILHKNLLYFLCRYCIINTIVARTMRANKKRREE